MTYCESLVTPCCVILYNPTRSYESLNKTVDKEMLRYDEEFNEIVADMNSSRYTSKIWMFLYKENLIRKSAKFYTKKIAVFL